MDARKTDQIIMQRIRPILESTNEANPTDNAPGMRSELTRIACLGRAHGRERRRSARKCYAPARQPISPAAWRREAGAIRHSPLTVIAPFHGLERSGSRVADPAVLLEPSRERGRHHHADSSSRPLLPAEASGPLRARIRTRSPARRSARDRLRPAPRRLFGRHAHVRPRLGASSDDGSVIGRPSKCFGRSPERVGRAVGPRRPHPPLRPPPRHPRLSAAPSSSPAPSAGPSAAPSPSPSPVSYPLTVTDDEGTSVVIPAKPMHIVSLTPATTEVIYALGAADRFVGDTDSDDYPPAATKVAHVATFSSVDVEKIVTLSTDLVIAGGDGFNPPASIAQLRKLGVPVIVVYGSDLNGVLHDINLVGEAIGDPSGAADLTASMRAGFDQIQAATASLPHPRVFYEIDATKEIYGPADQSFLAEMIQFAGGTPITTGSTTVYSIPLEKLVVADPQVIVMGDSDYGTTAADVEARPGWGTMTAVIDKAIVPIDDTVVTRPGPRLVRGCVTSRWRSIPVNLPPLPSASPGADGSAAPSGSAAPAPSALHRRHPRRRDVGAAPAMVARTDPLVAPRAAVRAGPKPARRDLRAGVRAARRHARVRVSAWGRSRSRRSSIGILARRLLGLAVPQTWPASAEAIVMDIRLPRCCRPWSWDSGWRWPARRSRGCSATRWPIPMCSAPRRARHWARRSRCLSRSGWSSSNSGCCTASHSAARSSPCSRSTVEPDERRRHDGAPAHRVRRRIIAGGRARDGDVLSGANLRQIFFYLLGSLDGASWDQFWVAMPIVLLGARDPAPGAFA